MGILGACVGHVTQVSGRTSFIGILTPSSSILAFIVFKIPLTPHVSCLTCFRGLKEINKNKKREKNQDDNNNDNKKVGGVTAGIYRKTHYAVRPLRHKNHTTARIIWLQVSWSCEAFVKIIPKVNIITLLLGTHYREGL